MLCVCAYFESESCFPSHLLQKDSSQSKSSIQASCAGKGCATREAALAVAAAFLSFSAFAAAVFNIVGHLNFLVKLAPLLLLLSPNARAVVVVVPPTIGLIVAVLAGLVEFDDT
jgi:hypothetical protein